MACKYYYDGAGDLIAIGENKEDREPPSRETEKSSSGDSDRRAARSHLTVVADNSEK